MREAKSRNVPGMSRSVRPVKRTKRSASDRADGDVCVDELSVIRMIGRKFQKIVFTDKVTKVASFY